MPAFLVAKGIPLAITFILSTFTSGANPAMYTIASQTGSQRDHLLASHGSFRFHSEFSVAVDLMRSGLVDVKPLITHTVKLEEAETACTIANDRNVAMKAQIAFKN